jgi:hypothetical protein
MNEGIPQYPIIDHADLVPRGQIRLVPEDKLSIFRKAELSQLRKGTKYKLVISDTPENRQNIAQRAVYYQMVAYREGWEFVPDNYQVEFVDPKFFLLSNKGRHKRIYRFKEGVESKKLLIMGKPLMGFENLSPERRAGFIIHKRVADRMDDEEADGLAGRVIKLFRR